MASRPGLIYVLAWLFSVISCILTLLVLFGGSTSTLASLFYLKTDTTNLNVPAKLAASLYLKDLSAVAARDYTGGDGTAASLGLAQTYTISLLASCAHGSSTVCSGPRLGFHFSPGSDLRLDGTALQGTQGSAFTSSWSSYATASLYLAIAYILSAVFVAVAPVLGLFARRKPSFGIASVALSGLAAVLLLSASIASLVIFTRLNTAFNSAFASAGLASSLGSGLFALSWLACLSAGVATGLFWQRLRRASASALDQRAPQGSPASKVYYGADSEPRGTSPAANEKTRQTPAGIWSRLPMRAGHKYVQVQKQGRLGMVSGKASLASQEAVVENQHEGEFAQGAGGDGERMFAMRPLRPERGVASTMYEPYGGGVI